MRPIELVPADDGDVVTCSWVTSADVAPCPMVNRPCCWSTHLLESPDNPGRFTGRFTVACPTTRVTLLEHEYEAKRRAFDLHHRAPARDVDGVGGHPRLRGRSGHRLGLKQLFLCTSSTHYPEHHRADEMPAASSAARIVSPGCAGRRRYHQPAAVSLCIEESGIPHSGRPASVVPARNCASARSSRSCTSRCARGGASANAPAMMSRRSRSFRQSSSVRS
jgi:hypothetical protein